MDQMPDDVLMEFFLREKDARTLASYSLVCRRWARILNATSFWVAKCKLDGSRIPEPLLPANTARYAPDRVDYRSIWRKNPYGRNLIKNDSGQDRFNHWKITPARWDNPQRIPGSNGETMHPIERNVDGRAPGGVRIETCFATPYFLCTKTQKVDLRAEGVQKWILRRIKPRIVVSECHLSRIDCKSGYGLVDFLDADDEKGGEIFTASRMMPIGRGGVWEKISHTFENYPDNIRYVQFASYGYGEDITGGQRGFFGAKMAKASVTFEF